jgi:nucleoid-associated protein YejK
MAVDYGKLAVNRGIVHEIPVRHVSGGQQAPTLSEIESPLTADSKNYFQERITDSLSHAAFEVRFDATSLSPVPPLVLAFLGGTNSDFVEISKTIARHLYASQTGVNTGGLLVVLELTYNSKPALAILKLEKEQAVRVRQTTHNNKPTFDIEHLRDLILGERTRVFKVGLFVPRGKTLETVEGHVADNQRGYLPKTEVADFFLTKFLGCHLREAADVSTKRFLQAAEKFINEEIEDPAHKAQYHMALIAELQSSKGQIRPNKFAATYLLGPDRKKFLTYLAREGVSTSPIEKDLALVEGQLKRMEIDFQSGIAVIGTRENFEQHVDMTTLDDGEMRVEIKDRVKTVRGRR